MVLSLIIRGVKRLIFILTILVTLFAFFFLFFSSQKESTKPFEEKQEVKKENQNKDQNKEINSEMKSLIFGEENFFFLVEKIAQPEKLILIPNFENKLSSTALFKNNQCQFLTNGGFYSEDNQPLAWFFTQDKLFKKETKSAFSNGFLSKDKNGNISLNNFVPTIQLEWGLQTGPLLIQNNQPFNLSLVHDELDRRVVAALNEKNELFFLIVTKTDSLAFGPLLKDLPLIVKEIGSQINESFQSAVNLDGGTASAFITLAKSIKEYTWIGSAFCLQSIK